MSEITNSAGISKKEKMNVVAILGPTACGKTKVAIELAKLLDGEIVSADSMQIYKDMDIGTAKPTAAEMGEVPHHLVDFWDICKEFSVADYVKMARECIFEITDRGKLPFIVGGTGLYVSSLLNNVNFAEQKPDPKLRKSLMKKLKTEGTVSLLAELASFDEEMAKRLHPNDTLRIIRAIEIYKTTGITMTEHIERSKNEEPPYNPVILGLTYRNRELLYDQINKRVDKMLDAGLIDEARRVLASNCSKTAMNAICYKELASYINGQCDLSAAVENLKQQTRRYAKRQLTWFRKDARVNWVFIDDYSDFEELLRVCTGIIKF